MNRKWWKETVVYQIYPRSFMDSNGDGIGDIKGIISKLDYLKLLGVGAVWLCPVYKSPNDDNGYDISDYQAIMEEFGTLEHWEELLKEMHNRGIKLIMDLVLNHTSDEHRWFIESRSSKNNPYRDYYIWREGNDEKEPNNWASCFSGSAWQYDETSKEYYLHIFSKKQPDLNWENEKVRREIYDMILWWLDKGVDGFRLDVINAISKVEGLPSVKCNSDEYQWGGEYFFNGPRIHEYLREMNRETFSKYDIMTVGEMPGVNPEQGALYVGEGRDELNMIFQFEHMDIDSGAGGKWDIIPWNLTKFKKIMSKWQVELSEKGWNSLYLNNHDQPRMVSRFGDDKQYRVESAKMLATLLHTMQGTPYIYQGEEIGMTNVEFHHIDEYRDIETLNMYKEKVVQNKEDESRVLESIHKKGRDNARTPMQWNESENAGFTGGTPWIKVNPNYKDINVHRALEDTDSIFYYYKELIEIRKRNPIIVYGSFEETFKDSEEIYAYKRELGNEALLVLLNFTNKEVVADISKELGIIVGELLIGNYEVEDYKKLATLKLSPYEARVYRIL